MEEDYHYLFQNLRDSYNKSKSVLNEICQSLDYFPTQYSINTVVCS